MITSGSQNVVKFAYLVSKDGGNNKCYAKFKNFIKLLMSPFLVMLQTFLPKEHSKGYWALKVHSKGTYRTLGHLGTQALEYLSTRRALGKWGTEGTLFSWLFSICEFLQLYLLTYSTRIYSVIDCKVIIFSNFFLLSR